MIKEKYGKVIKGLGGLFTVRVECEGGEFELYSARAKGILHKDEAKLLVGDGVCLTIDEDTPDGIVISSITERKNELIRPPMSNLDYLFITLAAKKPTPMLEVVDKLCAIAVHNGITPVIIITKEDLSPSLATEYADIYRRAGIETFVTSSESGEGTGDVRRFVYSHLTDGKTGAFAGASGVGKSTLMNALFASLSLSTSEISRKIERGRHTTRHVELFAVKEADDDTRVGFIADTPGFSLVDFARFDFFDIEDLPAAFPDILPYAEGCTYADCSHVGEGISECAVARAAAEGKIAPSRLESYRSVWRTLKNKAQY